MKTNIKIYITTALFGALLLGACQSGGEAVETHEIASQVAGDVRVVLLGGADGLAQGNNRFTVAFRSAADDQPVDAGTVTVGSSMAMPGMAPMIAPIELQPTGEMGQYALSGEFDMSGAWQFEIRWNGPVGQGSTSFRVNVR